MKTLLLALLLVFPVRSFAQVTFTRAELEAAADSALKGMRASHNESELRRAAVLYVRAIGKYETAYMNCDSINQKNKSALAHMEGEYAGASEKLGDERLLTARLKPWATVGKVGVYGTLAVGIIYGGMKGYQALVP